MDHLQLPPVTMVTTKAGAAAGTTTTTTIANAVQFCILGKAYLKAAATNAATPTTDFTTGAAFLPVTPGNGCAFVLGLDASGAIRVSQGPIGALDASGAFLNAPQFPLVHDTVAPYAYLVTRVGATGSAWTFGTSNLAGPPTGVTHAFTDVMTLPGRPQVA